MQQTQQTVPDSFPGVENFQQVGKAIHIVSMSAVLDKALTDWKKENVLIVGMAKIMQAGGVNAIGDMFKAARICTANNEVELAKIGMNLADPAEDFMRWGSSMRWSLYFGQKQIDLLRLNSYVLSIYDRYKAKHEAADFELVP